MYCKEFTITEDIDTRDNSPLWVVKITEKLSREEYLKVAADFKKINGYYSKFKKGFIFKYDPSEVLENVKENMPEKTTIETKNISLWERLQFTPGSTDTSKHNYKFVGSNYTGLTTKETAKIIRKHLKGKFPEVKFSVTSDYNTIDVTIKESPYNYSKLEYSPQLETRHYREHEEENNKELNAIKDYCSKLLSSYNYDDSDLQSDYFHSHFYAHSNISYEYIQTEQTEAVKQDITEYRNKLQEEKQAEEKRKEIEYQEYLKQREIDNIAYEERRKEEKKEIEVIYNSIEVKEIEEVEQYFITGSQFANLNKNNTLEEYQREVNSGEFTLENVKITREVHFNNEDALNYFSNMLLYDFDFLSGIGGTFTDDVRINSMVDFYNLNEEERKDIKWNLYGVAIYYNNELKFIVDAQGHNYARYVGLVDNVTIKKTLDIKQAISNEKLNELKENAKLLTDISFNVITDNNLIETWNSDNWSKYKELIKEELKLNNLKLSKSIIQQLPEDLYDLKTAMYKILIEVDGIQEQFNNADLQQGQKLTLFYISDWGSMVTNRIILDEVENKKYAQYDNAVKLTFTPQGKRKLYFNHWYGNILVYNGWLDLPVSVLHTVERTGTGTTITRTKYSSCDRQQYDAILSYFAETGIKPLVNTYKPTF